MILNQHYLGCLSQASYLIADERTRSAAVVDPRRDVEVYLEEAERLGVTIRHVLLTHFHADFVAGHLELARRTGAALYLGKRARAEFEFNAVGDGDVIEFGDVRLTILETPGHTPEGISIVVHDLAADRDAPYGVLTGDTLFIGDVGRPDLMASVGVSAAELAGMLYDSLHGKLARLPDATRVYPGHGAGSLCGKALSNETVSTIGEQKRFNYALQPMDEAAFVALVTADQPTAPRYFGYNADLNRRRRDDLDERLERELAPLDLAAFLAALRGGAQVIDARSANEFAAGHLEGSVNLGLDGRFASWAGTVLDPRRETLIVAEAPAEREAAVRLGRVGFERVVGYLAGGPEALEAAAERVRESRRITAPELAGELAGYRVVDVRTRGEFASGHVEGALHVPLEELEARAAELPADRPLALVCRSGYRSSLASSLLERAGRPAAVDLIGGMEAWKASGLPTVVEEAPACPSTRVQA